MAAFFFQAPRKHSADKEKKCRLVRAVGENSGVKQQRKIFTSCFQQMYSNIHSNCFLEGASGKLC